MIAILLASITFAFCAVIGIALIVGIIAKIYLLLDKVFGYNSNIPVFIMAFLFLFILTFFALYSGGIQ